MKPPVYEPGWPTDVVRVYRHDMQEIWDRSIAPYVWNQYHNQLNLYLSLVKRRGKQQKILDVGCAQGTLALLLSELGHEVYAVDIRRQFLDYAQSRYTHGKIHFLCGNIFEMNFDNGFDIIFANQIMEHVLKPAQLVERLAGWLHSSGIIVVTTPNGAYIRNNLPNFMQLSHSDRVCQEQFTADSDGHFFAYLDEELTDIFRDAGLKILESRYFETPWISGHMKIRYLHGFTPPWLLFALDRATLCFPWIERKLSHQIMIAGSKS